MLQKNEGILDRLLRSTFGVILLIVGVFWVGGLLKWIAIAIGAALLITGVIGFCGAYTVMFKTDTLKYGKTWPKWVVWFWVMLLLVAVIAGSYASHFFTKKFFLDDYNRMNNPYKQVLFQTGQGNAAEAETSLALWQAEWGSFVSKYYSYRPWVLQFDPQFSSDLEQVDSIKNQAAVLIANQNLEQAHLKLEEVRPIFNDMLKRNDFSLFAVALVDFHDAMEMVLDAAAVKDTEAVLQAYIEADKRLAEVELIENSEDIQVIRTNLEAVKSATKQDVEQLPDLANTLKSSYVKVYLQRG